jgi:hypothetical protein
VGSKDFAVCTERIFSKAAGKKLREGRRNALGVNAGRDESSQQDILHGAIPAPFIPCPQSVWDES